MIVATKTKNLSAGIFPVLLLTILTSSAAAKQLDPAEATPPLVKSPAVDTNQTFAQGSAVKRLRAPNRPVNVRDIPSPRNLNPNNWIVDLTGTVSPEATDYINRVCDEVNAATKREMCVVVVNQIQGNDHRRFATKLFNIWGVGNSSVPIFSGDWSNNGIMLFFALKAAKVELILGDGIGSPKQIKVAQKIIDDHVLPNMEANDPNSAMYQGIRTCATQLVGVSDLEAPVMLPSVAGERSKPRGPRRQQRGPVTWWPWLAGGGLLGGTGLLVGGRYYQRYRPRECDTCKTDLILLKEDEDDQFLDPGQQLEENLGSVDYDVWACLECENVLCHRYGKLFTRYSRCPDCRYITVHKIESTLVQANYSHGGKVQVRESCSHCDYHRRYTYLTPKKVKSSSSSSFGSRGGGSSRGSGFGGGRSSGGGASGSW